MGGGGSIIISQKQMEYFGNNYIFCLNLETKSNRVMLTCQRRTALELLLKCDKEQIVAEEDPI